MWHQLKHNITQEGIFGSVPGGSTFDALVTRQLMFNLHRITKLPLILLENDAKVCYDRIIPFLATHLFSIQGLPQSVASTIHNQLIYRTSRVLTRQGISTDSITSTPTSPLYGIGQGSGARPAAWHAHLLKMIETMSKMHPGYTTQDPPRNITYHQLMVTFVDDTSFLIND